MGMLQRCEHNMTSQDLWGLLFVNKQTEVVIIFTRFVTEWRELAQFSIPYNVLNMEYRIYNIEYIIQKEFTLNKVLKRYRS